jgi:hypothetical protein
VLVGVGECVGEDVGRVVAGDLGEHLHCAAADFGVVACDSGGEAGRVCAGSCERPAQGPGDVRIGFGEDGLGEDRGGHVRFGGEDGLLSPCGAG